MFGLLANYNNHANRMHVRKRLRSRHCTRIKNIFALGMLFVKIFKEHDKHKSRKPVLPFLRNAGRSFGDHIPTKKKCTDIIKYKDRRRDIAGNGGDHRGRKKIQQKERLIVVI